MQQQETSQGARTGRGRHNVGRSWGTPYTPGNNGKVQHRQKVEQCARTLADQLGGFDSLLPYRQALLREAAAIICGARPAGAVMTARRANSLARLFRLAGLSVDPPKRAATTRLGR